MAKFRVVKKGVIVEEGVASASCIPGQGQTGQCSNSRAPRKTRPPSVCPDCGKTYTRPWDVTRHKRSTGCGGCKKADYFCERCDAVFHRKESRDVHVETCGMGLKAGRPVGSKTRAWVKFMRDRV